VLPTAVDLYSLSSHLGRVAGRGEGVVPVTAAASLTLPSGLQMEAVLVRPITPRRSPWSAQDGFDEFENFLGVLSRIIDDDRLAILTAGMNAYGPPPDPPGMAADDQKYNDEVGYYSWCLATTLPGSASAAVSDLGAQCEPEVPEPWGRVVGTKRVIHQLASYVPPSALPDGGRPLVIESIPLPTARQFRDLLARAPARPVDPYDPSGLNRHMFVFGIGKCVGEYHNRLWFDEDLHEGNFINTPEGVVNVDYAHSCITYRPLTAFQAAATLLPLLSSFSKDEWFWFERGYVIGRGAAGREVVELIDPASELLGH
jgi:hypothetical protein